MSKLDKNKKANVEWLANNYGWELFEYQAESYMLRYTKQSITINVWLSKMTIAIVHNGKQHFIKKVNETKLEQIFINPLKFI